MTSGDLQRIGQALYGSAWQSSLARDLGVADRTVRRWVAGQSIPGAVTADLAQICHDRIATLQSLCCDLEGGK